MHSSTLWSNLYLTESKYNLRVRPVDWLALSWPIFLIIMLFVITFVAYKPTIFIPVAAILVCGYGYLFWRYWHDTSKTPGYYHQSLVLHENGELSVNQLTLYRLQPNSRIGWLGCWLILQSDEVKSQPALQYKFYAKQQFSAKDYARLSRFVLRNKTLRPQLATDSAIK